MNILKKLFGNGSSETLAYKPEAKVHTTERSQKLSLTLAPGVTLKLVRIPTGEFLMGSDKDKDDLAWDDETPQHRLYLEEYLIGKTPVTNAQYQAFVEATVIQGPEHWGYYDQVPDLWKRAVPQGKEQHPVFNVSWDKAMAFCQWASQVSGREVRLPSEAQWEKAARGTDGRIYPRGNQPPHKKVNFKGKDTTTPVGQYGPRGDSPYGCADMVSNVHEWTSSLYKDYPYDAKDGREDFTSRDKRVLRGCPLLVEQKYARCAARDESDPWGEAHRYYGFRVEVSPFQAQFTAPLF